MMMRVPLWSSEKDGPSNFGSLKTQKISSCINRFRYRSITYWSLWGSTCTTCCWTRSSSEARVHPQPLGGLRDPRRLPAGERVVDLGVWGCPPHALLPGKPERPGAPPLQDAVTGLLLCRPVLLLVLLQAGGDRGGAFPQAQRGVRKRQVPPGAPEGWKVWIFLLSCDAEGATGRRFWGAARRSREFPVSGLVPQATDLRGGRAGASAEENNSTGRYLYKLKLHHHQREQTVRRRDDTEPPSMFLQSVQAGSSQQGWRPLRRTWWKPPAVLEELTCWMFPGRNAGAGPGGRARGRDQRSRVVAMVTSDPEGRGRWRLPRTAPPRLKMEIRTWGILTRPQPTRASNHQRDTRTQRISWQEVIFWKCLNGF